MRISDWSSDVCSSDPRVLLPSGAPIDALQGRIDAGWTFSRTNITEKFGYDQFREQLPEGAEPVAVLDEDNNLLLFSTAARQIGRASCRGNVCQYVYTSGVAVSLTKKQNTQIK